jgi:ABC-type multidrug transport system fused ATPase/permease subunit
MNTPTMPTGGAPDLSVLRRGWALLEPRERRMAWVVLGVVVASAISAAVMVGSILPFLTVLSDPSRIETVPQLAWLYERLGFTSQFAFIVALGLATIAMIVAANLMQILRTYVVARYTMMRTHSLSYRLLAHYLHQPYAFFLTAHSGDMSAKILNESTQVVQSFLRPAAEVISAAITLLMILSVVIWVDPVIALSAIIVLGAVFGLIFAINSRQLTAMGRDRNTANKDRYRVAGEALEGIKDVKLLGGEHVFLSRFTRHSLKMAQSNVGKSVATQLPPYLIQTVIFSGVILLCLLTLDAGAADPAAVVSDLVPTLGVMALAAQRLMPELSRLFSNAGLLRYGQAAVDAVYADLVEAPQSAPAAGSPPAPMRLRCVLELDRLSYMYPNSDRPGLKDISFKIEVGERIGVVGTSGAGKTTLADVLLGLLNPASGQIRVDGTSVTPERLPAWRQNVGYVPQVIYLMDASVTENIAFGTPPGKIDRARVEAAARYAQLDAFIRTELPQGYDTPIGERGLRLSGGQRQRIGIARALYRDADLIVFDEATSALDNVTEQEVMAATEGLPGDKTLIMIAHRLSTVRRCNRILVLDKGRVAGFDTWERLEVENSIFQSIVQSGEKDLLSQDRGG